VRFPQLPHHSHRAATEAANATSENHHAFGSVIVKSQENGACRPSFLQNERPTHTREVPSQGVGAAAGLRGETAAPFAPAGRATHTLLTQPLLPVGGAAPRAAAAPTAYPQHSRHAPPAGAKTTSAPRAPWSGARPVLSGSRPCPGAQTRAGTWTVLQINGF
jgi:hypothetical protein